MHFLISGIPASGKSSFCKWLEQEKGFLHLDVEEAGVLDRRKIEAALPEINALFGSHKEYTLPSTGIYTPPETIWKSMLDTLVEPSRRRLGAPLQRPKP